MIDISEGITLFNDCDFFAAHDFFEEIWLEANREEKEFFQGLVQISVGLYHLICGNLKGAKSQLIKGKTKLEKYLPNYYNINLSLLIKKIDDLLINLKFGSNINKEIPTFELIN